MIWEDARAYAQIVRSTAAADKTGKCLRYCSRETAPGGIGYCCDGMWLPTLRILGTLQKVCFSVHKSEMLT